MAAIMATTSFWLNMGTKLYAKVACILKLILKMIYL